jgi:1,4-dihydroxy-2-naphthoate octaprenyltransferase
VRLGDRGTRWLYVGLIAAAVVMAALIALGYWQALLALLALPLLWRPLQALRGGATGPALVPVLAATGLFEVAYAVLLATGIAWGSA